MPKARWTAASPSHASARGNRYLSSPGGAGVRRTQADSVDPDHVGGVERRGLGDAVGTEAVTINHYVVAPGERISGLHAHADQEEVFVVLEGTVALETLDGTLAAAEGEAIRVAPGEFQSVTNPAAEPATLLALGAPRGTSDLRVPVRCPACGAEVAELDFAGGEERLVCTGCGNERDAACPACGGERWAVLGEDGWPVSVCRDCGATTSSG